MTDHKAFLATIPPQTRARLTERSDRAGLLRLSLHLGAILAMGVWIALGLPLWWLLIWPQGIALAFLFTMQHEATHSTPFASGWLNEAAGHLAGLVLIQPFEWFRSFHMAHHRYTNDPANDPELAEPKPETIGQFAWHLSTIGYWGSKLSVLTENAFGRIKAPYIPTRLCNRIRGEARAYLTAYAALLLVSLVTPLGGVLLWCWLIPIATGFPVLRLYLLAEHGRCPAVADMFENTRTTFTDGLTRMLTWNMPYHAEHHAWPSVPFHKLPEVHNLARDHLKVTSPSYRAFAKDYARNLGARP